MVFQRGELVDARQDQDSGAHVPVVTVKRRDPEECLVDGQVTQLDKIENFRPEVRSGSVGSEHQRKSGSHFGWSVISAIIKLTLTRVRSIDKE